MDSASRRSNQGRTPATTSVDDRHLLQCAGRKRTATQAELGSFLAANSGRLLKGQPCVEGFTNMVFMRDDQPFASGSRQAIDGNVCSWHVNLSTGRRVLNGGLFSSRMSPSLALKAIVGLFSFGDNLELVSMQDTSMKEVHTDHAVSVYGVVSLGGDAHTSMSFPVEMLIFTPFEMTS
ncbi:hypothetical protein TNCV_4556311 [Trichonephila clavipes]|nr:hypothetical protein TNCV_4556311 [Trichonephila clavipes]